MFNQFSPRAGKPGDKKPGGSRLYKTLAAGGAVVLAVGLTAAAAPLTASAAADPLASYSKGQFLSGSVLGIDLDKIASISPAIASNTGSTADVEEKNPLSVGVLNNAINLPLTGTNINVNGLLGLTANSGVLGQYAKATNDGDAMASTGAVGSDGGITTGDASGSGSAQVSLGSLMGGSAANALADLKLQLNAISSSASGTGHTGTGTYSLAGAKLAFTSPALGDIVTDVNNAIKPAGTALDSLAGNLQNLGLSGLNLDGGSLANVKATATVSLNSAQLQSQIDSLLTGTIGSGAVTVNLSTGEVTVDLEKLTGGSLNNKPVDYELLSPAAIDQIGDGVATSLGSILDGVTSKLTSLLGSASVNVQLSADVLGSGLAPLTGVVNGVGGVVGGVGGLLNGITGGLGLGSVVPQGSAGSPALLGLNANISGSVQQLLSKTGTATASLSLAGTKLLDLDASPLLGTVGSLLGVVSPTGGTTSTVTSALSTVFNGLGSLFQTGGSGFNALNGVVSLRLNHQSTALMTSGGAGGGTAALGASALFTETAVQLRVGGGNVATVNLANSTVAPSLPAGTTPGCTTDCGPGGPGTGCTTDCGPGGPGTPGGPNGPGTPGTPTSHTTADGSLAFTGVGVATIVAVLLALLAAGAYLAREGYRRNHPRVLS